MNHKQDPAYAPTLTALPAYTEPPTEQFPAVSPDPRVVYVQQAPEPKNGFGITSFACGLAALICGLIPILSVPAIAGGLIGFGFGMGGVKRLRAKKADNKVMTWIGVIVSVLAAAAGVYGMYVVNKAIGDLQTDLNNISATPAA